jgi:hypothetical protein
MNIRLAFCAAGVLLAMQAVASFVPTAEAQTSASPAANVSSIAPAATGAVVGPGSQPQAGVPVIVEGPMGKTHAFTDSKGNWSLYNLEPGEYHVKAAMGSVAEPSDPVVFTVKERGVFGKIFGSEPPAVTTSAIKLNQDFKQ